MGQINVIAHLNELTKDVKNDYYGTPQVVETLTPTDIIGRMKAKEMATKNVDGEAFIKSFMTECALAVAEGNNIVTPLYRIALGMQGVIYSEDLGHNIPAERLNVSANLMAGEELRKAIAGSTVYVFEQAGATGPVIQTISDPTEKEPGHLNPGAMVLLQGMRLALKGDDPSVGILFTSADNPGTTVAVAPAQVYPNMPTKLQFSLPAAVTEGEWHVSVTTQASGSSTVLLKSPRTFQFPETVIVGNPGGGSGDRPEIE